MTISSKSMSIRLQLQEWFLENKITWVTMLAVLAAVQVGYPFFKDKHKDKDKDKISSVTMLRSRLVK